VGLVFLCTLLGAAGQVLIKMGAKGSATAAPWTTVAGIWANLWAMATNPSLIGGYALYALMTVAFIYALRDEELSIMYPIISLTYVWVAGLSAWLFGETVNLHKVLGVLIIVAGVGVLGKDGGAK
jgi:drug/metabolite transporter (DMT)-like permease